MILKEGLQDQVLLNVNVPEPWNGNVKFTRPIAKNHAQPIERRKRSARRSYFWLFEQKIDKDVEPDTDYAAIFFRRCLHYTIAPRSHAHPIAEPSFSLGRANRCGIPKIKPEGPD